MEALAGLASRPCAPGAARGRGQEELRCPVVISEDPPAVCGKRIRGEGPGSGGSSADSTTCSQHRRGGRHERRRGYRALRVVGPVRLPELVPLLVQETAPLSVEVDHLWGVAGREGGGILVRSAPRTPRPTPALRLGDSRFAGWERAPLRIGHSERGPCSAFPGHKEASPLLTGYVSRPLAQPAGPVSSFQKGHQIPLRLLEPDSLYPVRGHQPRRRGERRQRATKHLTPTAGDALKRHAEGAAPSGATPHAIDYPITSTNAS